jgi:hypothetical protein
MNSNEFPSAKPCASAVDDDGNHASVKVPQVEPFIADRSRPVLSPSRWKLNCPVVVKARPDCAIDGFENLAQVRPTH